MININKTTVSLIIVSSILVTFIFNLSGYWRIVETLERISFTGSTANVTITITEEEDWFLLGEWYEDNPGAYNEPEFKYPLDIVFADNLVFTLHNKNQMHEVESFCSDWSGCFQFVLPVSYQIADSSVIVISKEDDLDKLVEWYETHPRSNILPTLLYPVEVEFEDGTLMTVHNDSQKEFAKNLCDEWASCFYYELPVSFIMPDSSTITVNEDTDWRLIREWYIKRPGIIETPTLQYPVTLIFYDEIETVHNENDFQSAKELCHDEFGECFEFVLPITLIMPDEYFSRMYWLLLGIFVQVILFCSMALANTQLLENRWVRKKTPVIRASFIIVTNLILYAIINVLEMGLFDVLFGLSRHISNDYFLFANFPIAGVAVAETYFIIVFAKLRRSETEVKRLIEEKASAELAALKDQISPHFLFNSLNSLTEIIRNENKSHGLDYVQNMSRVYRYILDSHRHDLVRISEELDFLDAYIYMLKKRFDNKLHISIDIPDAMRATSIPPMTLQLLIENTVKHNKVLTNQPLMITIKSEGDALIVENTVNKKTTEGTHGIGLINLSKRYQLLAGKEIEIYDENETFTVKLPVIAK